jgi:hypothetical protein
MSKKASVPEHAALSRRGFVKVTALMAGGVALAGAGIRPAAAQKVAKAAMKYQETPNGSKACANCMQFIPGSDPKANGTCKVVEGSISPHGYCIAWAAKAG